MREPALALHWPCALRAAAALTQRRARCAGAWATR